MYLVIVQALGIQLFLRQSEFLSKELTFLGGWGSRKLYSEHINKELTSLSILVCGLKQRKQSDVVESNVNRRWVGRCIGGGLVVFGRRQPSENLVDKHSKGERGAFEWLEGRPARLESGG